MHKEIATMPSILRSMLRTVGLLVLMFVAAHASFASSAGEPITGAYVTFELNPPPANQTFHGMLHRQGHPGSLGFLADASGIALHRITADSIDFLFDTGCGFLCPPLPPEVIASPFTLPALPAGPHRVRILSNFGDTPQILADFTIAVGGGAAGAVALPLGGSLGNGLLGVILAAAGVLMLGRRMRRRRA
jgi:hypothetical protein